MNHNLITEFCRRIWYLVGALGDGSCLLCGGRIEDMGADGEKICTLCREKLRREAEVVCPVCGRGSPDCICRNNLSPVPGRLGERTWLAHGWYRKDEQEDMTRRMVLSCKNKPIPAFSKYIAECMAAHLETILPAADKQRWILTYTPRSAAGYNRHGFDQCMEITRILGKQLKIPTRTLLVRVGGTEQKNQGNAEKRRENITGAFAIVPSAAKSIRNSRILLFDDIITTGTTMTEAARVLILAGADVVFPMAFLQNWPKELP